MAEAHGYELALFGDVRLRAADGAIVALGRRAKALLAYLALARDRQATRERLCGLLWPDRGEAQARASLRQCLVEIRLAVSRADPAAADDSLLIADRGGVALNGALVSDLAALEAAATDPPRFAAALAAVAAEPLLDGLELGDAWDEWLHGVRAQLEARLAALVRARLDALAAAADWDAVARLADAWTLRDPFDEAAVAAAIRADLARDNPAGARRRHKALADRLARDGLGAPGETVRAALANGCDQAGAPPATVPPAVAPDPDDAPPLLRVAPFADAELGGGQAHLAAALRDEIVSGLARYRDLRLVAADGDAGGGTGYTLLASLRPAGPAIALAARLLRSADRVVVWTDRFELPLDALQTVVERIVGRIVAAVAPAVTADVVARAPAHAAHGLYSRYLLARQQSLEPPDHATALAAAAELEAIVAADPRFAPPLLPLARLYNTDYVWTRAGSTGPARRGVALELARTALALDRGDVHAWTLLGWCNLWRGAWTAARQHFDFAVAHNPYHVDRLLEVAMGLAYLSEIERARAMLTRVLELEPMPGDAWWGDSGLLHLLCGEHDHAGECFDMIAAPDFWMQMHATANAALAGHPASPLRDRAAASLRAMQPDGVMPPLPALLEWVEGNQPFRMPEHRALLVAGVARAFG